MSKQEWTKEPWRFADYGINTIQIEPDIRQKDERGIVFWSGFTDNNLNDLQNKANARRIVDCVNACAGIDSPAEYISSLRQENERFKVSFHLLQNELTKLDDLCRSLNSTKGRSLPEKYHRKISIKSSLAAQFCTEVINGKSPVDALNAARQALTKEG